MNEKGGLEHSEKNGYPRGGRFFLRLSLTKTNGG
jgi:hypothetical protein